ncbi:AAA family ATPase [Streptosporangium canum]|uniref:AAA family ATPase n=1 Tax=Streptosporangium canum TaxID=324952 RepID=UPI00343F472E
MANSELAVTCGRLINECLDREDGPGGGELPVIVLFGPRGSGKTTLLKEVAENAAASFSLPFVHIDCAEHPDMKVGEITAQIARRVMGHRWRQFAPVKLPRVVLGNLALSLDPGLRQEEAEQELYELIRGRRGIPDSSKTLQEIFNLLGGSVPVLPVAGPLIATMIDRIARGRRLVDLLERKGMAWYRDRLDPGGLTDLARSGAAEDGSPAAAQIICEALLEDLREGWSRKWRPRNCLVLLDNSDSPSGREFLRALVAAKAHRAAAPGPAGGDPLLVVATSRSWQDLGHHWDRPGTLKPPEDGAARHPRRLRQAGHGDWLANRADGRRDRWWYPVLLPGLSRTEVTRMRGATRGRPGRAHTGFVHALTGGHPLAVTHLLEAMAARERGESRDSARTGREARESRAVREHGQDPHENTDEQEHGQDPHENADARERGQDTGWTEQGLRALPALGRAHAQHPFRDFPHDLEDLVACSAATNLADADDAGLLSRPWRSAVDELGDQMWLVPGPGQERAPAIHPWLRRLLLRELERRHRRDGPLWDIAHQRLEALYTSREDLPRDRLSMVMHHRLARVDLTAAGRRHLREVAALLDGRFNRIDMAAWIRQYNWITSAPNRLPVTMSPDDLYGRLIQEPPDGRGDHAGQEPPEDPRDHLSPDRTGGAERLALVRSVVVDRWFLSDPGVDPLHGRRRSVADGLRLLARYATSGRTILVNEAHRYDREDDDE